MEYKILVVDDNEDDIYFFKKSVVNSGIKGNVLTAADGVDGLELIKEHQFDCIFLDYFLPGADGMDLLKEIRLLEIDTPIIMLTGQKDEKTIVKLIQEGATDYLSKDSLSPEALRLSIENSQKLYIAKQEKKIAEQEVRTLAARLSEAQRIAKIGNWEYCFDSKSLFLSEEAYRILEFDPNNSTSHLINFCRKVHQDDFNTLKQAIKNLENIPNYDINLRINSGNNTVKYLNAKGHITYNEQGNKNKLVCTVQDITVLKNALLATQKATIKRRATSIVLSIAVLIFLISEAVLDPFIESLTASLLIALPVKGSIVLFLKPVESLLEKIMINRLL